MKMLKKFCPDVFESHENISEKQLIYSELTLKEVSLQEYEKGFQAGILYKEKEQLLQHNAQKYAQTLDIIALTYEKITALFEMEKKYIQNFKQEVSYTTQECLQTLFPLMKKELGDKNIQAMIEQALDSVIGEEPIQIFASSEDKESFVELLENQQLLFSFQDEIPSGDCHVKWKGGGGFWRQQETYEKICTFLQGAQ